MDQNLQDITDFIQQNPELPAEQKESVLKSIKAVDKELQILSFKLDRTEKVKRTTAILLEETIEELEQKRKAVEETLNRTQGHPGAACPAGKTGLTWAAYCRHRS